MPRLIKRYANRKLYDVEASAYVSLEDVARLIRRGETVQIVDNVSGEEITAQTLTQVILDEGKRGESLLPTELLHELLRRGGQVLDTGLTGLGQVRSGVDGLLHSSLGRLTKVLQGPEAEELQRLREQLQQLEQTLARVLEEREAEPERPAGSEGV